MVWLRTVDRALEILTLFDQGHPRLNMKEISERMHMASSTTYKYVEVLRHHRFLEADELQGYYRLGTKILQLSAFIKSQLKWDVLVRPIMTALKKRTGETVFITAVRGQKGVCLDRIESDHNVKFSFEPGNEITFHAGASGKILLAYLNEKERRRILSTLELTKYTESTITNREQLVADLEGTRTRGYALSTEERDIGARAVAVPILDSNGELVAAITICGPVQRFGTEKIAMYGQYAAGAAEEIVTRLKEKGIIS